MSEEVVATVTLRETYGRINLTIKTVSRRRVAEGTTELVGRLLMAAGYEEGSFELIAMGQGLQGHTVPSRGVKVVKPALAAVVLLVQPGGVDTREPYYLKIPPGTTPEEMLHRLRQVNHQLNSLLQLGQDPDDIPADLTRDDDTIDIALLAINNRTNKAGQLSWWKVLESIRDDCGLTTFVQALKVRFQLQQHGWLAFVDHGENRDWAFGITSEGRERLKQL